MRFDGNSGRRKNDEPNSYDTPAETGGGSDFGYPIAGMPRAFKPVLHAEDNDFI
jgi:ankyrin repeat protein